MANSSLRDKDNSDDEKDEDREDAHSNDPDNVHAFGGMRLKDKQKPSQKPHDAPAEQGSSKKKKKKDATGKERLFGEPEDPVVPEKSSLRPGDVPVKGAGDPRAQVSKPGQLSKEPRKRLVGKQSTAKTALQKIHAKLREKMNCSNYI